MLTHYRGRWPDADVPEDMPVWLYDEVDSERDNVLRRIDQFADGRRQRNSVEMEAHTGAPCPSLVHGPFASLVAEAKLDIIAASEFEDLWAKSEDARDPA